MRDYTEVAKWGQTQRCVLCVVGESPGGGIRNQGADGHSTNQGGRMTGQPQEHPYRCPRTVVASSAQSFSGNLASLSITLRLLASMPSCEYCGRLFPQRSGVGRHVWQTATCLEAWQRHLATRAHQAFQEGSADTEPEEESAVCELAAGLNKIKS